MKNKKVICPECQNTIEVEENVLVGDIIECVHCGAELRVTSLDSDGTVLVEVIEEEK